MIPLRARSLPAVLALMGAATTAGAIEFGLPADCTPGETCFFQQYADMDASDEARDPFCGAATYDGHTGTDLRILSIADMARGVPVVAMAAGRVLRMRDGEEDRLVGDEASRAAVADRECGNGLVLAHEEGYETQYCHLRNASIVVKPGDRVNRGDRLGEIGASGLAQFPHVHVAVRRDGETLDPVTGRAAGAGCGAEGDSARPLFASDVLAHADGESQLLAGGLAGGAVDHDLLAIEGPPPAAAAGDAATVGWAWFANLREGDRIRLRVTGPDGTIVAEHTGEPLDRTKATYSAYAGKRGGPAAGRHTVAVALLREGAVVVERAFTEDVR